MQRIAPALGTNIDQLQYPTIVVHVEVTDEDEGGDEEEEDK